MQKINFPTYKFRLKSKENKVFIFDSIRKKFVVLQPEEWVRQHCIQFLIQEMEYPESLINVEKELIINQLKKRYDIVVFNPDSSIRLVVECKSPSVEINQDTFDQIARYNIKLNADYLMVTNGINHYYCQMDYALKRYCFLKKLPKYST